MSGERVMWLVWNENNMNSYIAADTETAWQHARVDQLANDRLLHRTGWRCSRIVVEGEGDE